MYISNGGVANNTIVNSGGLMDILSGGTANSVVIDACEEVCVYSGGTATDKSMLA